MKPYGTTKKDGWDLKKTDFNGFDHTGQYVKRTLRVYKKRARKAGKDLIKAELDGN